MRRYRQLRFLGLMGLLAMAAAFGPRPAAAEAPEGSLSFVGTSTTLASPRDRGKLRVTLGAPNGYVVERAAPLRIQLSTEGLALKRTRLNARQLPKPPEDPETEVTLAVPFTAKAPGRHAIEVDALFYICDQQRCRRQVRRAAVEVSVGS